MCRFYGKEEQIKAMQARAADLRRIADIYPVFAEVTRKWDGKVFDARYKNDVAAETGAAGCRLIVDLRNGWIDCENLHAGNFRSLARLKYEDLPGEKKKRVSADMFCTAAQEGRAKLLQEAAALDRTVADYENIMAQLDALKKAYNAIVDALPYDAHDITGISKRW